MAYLAILDEENGAFGVIFPDAPGCTAMGRTREAALRHAKLALAEWIEDEIAEGRKPPYAEARLQVTEAPRR